MVHTPKLTHIQTIMPGSLLRGVSLACGRGLWYHAFIRSRDFYVEEISARRMNPCG